MSLHRPRCGRRSAHRRRQIPVFSDPGGDLAGLAVVVSPLISLMKDQVDALTECGVPAARIDSSLSPEERDDRPGSGPQADN